MTVRRLVATPRRIGVLVGVLCLAVVAAVVGPRVLSAATPHLYAGTVMQASGPAPTLSELSFADGSPVELDDFGGEVVLLYFGYTSCPDVCPTTLAMASQALGQLSEADRARVHLIMVTLDPGRDLPDTLQEYVQYFHPSFAGARGGAEQTLRVATQYGIFYDVRAPADPARPDEYFVDHTSTLMAIDPGGALRIVWAPDVTADEVAADLAALLDT